MTAPSDDRTLPSQGSTSETSTTGLGDAPTELGLPGRSPSEAPSIGDDPTELGLDGPRHSPHQPTLDPKWPTIGRYRLAGRLGAGAMGTVFEALDPSLDRPVAIKVLHAEMPAAARQRMQREATALARLSHPNVVQVFEVGEDRGQTFIAMELVRGQTLAAWAQRKPAPTWSEIVDVYAQAAAGLAAAHAAGLVHRDFKPGNCIMGDDGRVRVVDFGLAKDVGHDDAPTTEDATTATADVALTQQGALLGTPAYMAPELLGGQPGSPAGDQFALCVSLWEALHGQRPFVGDTLAELSVRILEGTITEPTTSSTVPRWLRAIVERGMSVEPAHRWPSMEALLEALARGRARARRRVLGWSLGAAVAVVTTLVGWQHHDERQRIAACERAGREIDQVWSADIATTTREALMSTGVARAELTADKVLPWLDDHASAWASVRTEVCLGAEVEGTWPADALEHAMWCLDERRFQLEQLVTWIGRGRAQMVDEVVWETTKLGRVEPCGDPAVVLRMPLPPAEGRATVREIRAEVERAEALWHTGDYEQGLDVVRDALRHAEVLAWPPLVAEAHLKEGWLLDGAGRYADAEQSYEHAFFEAAHVEAAEQATAAAGSLVQMLVTQQRLDDARRWSRHEELWVSRLPDVSGLWRAQHLDRLATVLLGQSKLAEAKSILEEAMALAERELGPDHVDLGVYTDHLANIHMLLGELSQGRALLERAVAIKEQGLGPDHPALSATLNNLGNVLQSQGAYDEAIPVLERSLRIAELMGVGHVDMTGPLSNLANIHRKTGHPEQAIANYERVLSLLEQQMDPDHPEIARTLANLANCHSDLGDTEQAREIHLRVLLTLQKKLGPDHPDVAMTLVNLANAERLLGRFDQARPRLEDALRIFEQALGPKHPVLHAPLLNLALIALAQERPADAVAAAERALQIMEASQMDPSSMAQARFLVARTLGAAGQDPERARALAEQALAWYREHEEADKVKNVEEWLAQREP